jgi:hypothetical protein
MSDLQVPVTLGLKDPELLTRQAKAAEQGFKASMGAMKGHAESLGSSITRMAAQAGTALAAMFAVSKFKDMIQGSIEYGASIENMSRKMGLSTNEYQKLSYVAKQSGGDIDRLGRAFSTMSKLAETSNSILGVSTKDSNGHLKDQGKLFEELLIRISEIPNPTERMAASMKVFGMSGREVFNIASQGKDRIHELMEETNGYGIIIDKSVLKRLHDAEEAQNRLNFAWKNASAEITVSLVPAITELLPLLTEGAQALGWMLGGEKRQADALKTKQDILDMQEYSFVLKNAYLSAKAAGVDSFATMDKYGTVLQHTMRGARAEYVQLQKDIAAGSGKAFGGGETPSAANQFGDFMDKNKKTGGGKSSELKTQEEEYAKISQLISQFDEKELAIAENHTKMVVKQAKEEHEELDKEDKIFYSQLLKAREILEKNYDKILQQTSKGRETLLQNQQKKDMKLMVEVYGKGSKELTTLEKQQAEERIELARKEKEMKIQFGLDYASHTLQMLTTIADASKANAQVKKRLAEAEAIVSGGKAVLGIVENQGQFISAFGPIAGPIAEGVEISLTVAEVAAQISKIESAKFARGTSFAPGGMALVGEEGPELVNLPRGSQVLTNAQTSNYFNSGGDHIHFHSPQIIIHGNPDQKTIGRMTQAFNEAFTQNTHKAMRTLQTRGKLPGTTIFG